MDMYPPKELLRAAQVAHEVNRTYCQSLGDTSQPAWADAPAWLKDSAVQGVLAIIRNPDTTPEESHKSWMEQKFSDGWVWGPVKIPEQKLHPCMVLYEHLGTAQMLKDHLFISAVKATLNL